MASKITLFLGSLIAVLITFTCIQNNRSQLTASAELNQSTETVVQAVTTDLTDENRTLPVEELANEETAKEKTIAQIPASLLYRSDPKPTLHVALNKQNETIDLVESLSRLCNSSECDLSTEFNETIKEVDWQEDALNLLEAIHQNNWQHVQLTIKDKNLSIVATLPNAKSRDATESLLERLSEKGFKVDANLTLPSVSEENLSDITTQQTDMNKTSPEIGATLKPEDTAKEQGETQNSDQNQTTLKDLQQKRIENIQKDINAILKTHPIYFKRNSNELTLTSKQILDKIIALVNKNSEEIERLRILGHTDASGSAAYNKQLSQRRAESVKNYLHAHHIKVKKLEAVGYGEEKPLTQNPYDKRNRRVEIEIVKEQSHD